MINIPLDGQYQSDSLTISNQLNVNCYINIPQTQSFSQANLFGTAGIDGISTTGASRQANRGSHVKDGKPYFVNGETLYRQDLATVAGSEVFTNVVIGTIAGTGRVSMADNGTQLMVLIPGGNGYIINEAASPVFQQIIDADFTANGLPQYVAFVDSFFVVTTNTKKFIKSAPNNGLDWNALDFGSAESDPDDIVSLIINKNRVYIAGSETIEEFQNVGSGGFPFQRTGMFIPKGVFAPLSMVNVGGSFMWIGGGKNEGAAIWQLNGSTAVKVSNTAIDSQIQKFSQDDLRSAFAYSFSQNGQTFVGFTFPRLTIEYNIISGKWNEKKSQIINASGFTELIRWRCNSLVTAYGRLIVFDSQDGRVGELKADTYTEYDRVIIRKFSTFTIFNDESSFSIPEVELTMESGVGNAAQPNPQIRMSTSRDDKKFNDPITRFIGPEGDNERRQIWARAGRFPRMCICLFEYSDPCKFAVLRLGMRVKGGKPHG
jgi:hypothetical protein